MHRVYFITCLLLLVLAWQVPAAATFDELDLALSPRGSGSGSDRSRSPSPTKPKGGSSPHHPLHHEASAKPASPGHPGHTSSSGVGASPQHLEAHPPLKRPRFPTTVGRPAQRKARLMETGTKRPWWKPSHQLSRFEEQQLMRYGRAMQAYKKAKSGNQGNESPPGPHEHHEHPPKGPKGSPPGSPGGGSHAVSRRNSQEKGEWE